jgi:hypothetical protein
MLNISCFAKILALAGSDKDGEALAALRKAQKMLHAAHLSFTDVAQSFEAGRHGSSGSDADHLRRCLAEAEKLIVAYQDELAELQAMQSTAPGGSPGQTRAAIAERMRSILGDARLSCLSDREIARRTGLSPQTIGNWRRRLAAERAQRRHTVHNGRRRSG